MRYIRSCPRCSMELRFPLDMGVLIITCPNCKTSFRMDPDDPDTYLTGAFDLSPPKKKSPFRFPFADNLVNYFNSTIDIRFLIPIFLFLILLLNLIKIFNSAEQEQKENIKKDKPELFQEPPTEIPEPEIPSPDNDQENTKPSIEI